MRRSSCNCPQAPRARDRDVLSVAIDDGDGHELWHKNIPVMLVRRTAARTHDFGASLRETAVRRADLGARSRDREILESSL